MNLGQIYLSENKINEAVNLFAIAARNGSSAACMNMGVAYIKGAGGLERDLKKAMFWFRKSNSADGFWQVFKTFQLYNKEEVKDNDDSKHEERCWLRKAAMAGHEDAITIEARKLVEEDGDIESAIQMYKKLELIASSSERRSIANSAVQFLESRREIEL